MCIISVGIINIKNASAITVGVYIFENFVMNFSVCAFFSPAFSTRSKILLNVDSLNSFVTLISRTPFVFITPLRISELISAFLGTDSPVSADVSINASPDITIPSNGTLSPGFTIITSPTLTSSGDFSITVSFIFTKALSGFSSIKLSIDFLDLFSAYSSKISPTWKNSITAIASGYSPVAKAPRLAMLIKNSSPKSSLSFIPSNASKITSYPIDK